MKPSRIDLRIDELVLDGVPLTDRVVFENAVRRGLEQALSRTANQAALRSLCHRDRIDGGELTFRARDAAGVGEALAAAIVAALRSSASGVRGSEAP